ncbi:MAG TPA: phosphatase PAP2 family protein [Candidatus Kryptobacter bacterium]|nr:MAG: hypothetical protein B7Z63_00530 [Ignavibacteriae bacterium 37-53-5]HQT90774.1 phosphatase PAP2 family protein [Candidatus Kryptobacter bacterium]
MKTECSLIRRRSGSARAAAFFCTALLLLPTFAHAEPPKWDVSIFRSINDSRSGFMDGAVGTNDNLVLPLVFATPIVFAGVGLARNDAYTFDTGAIVGVTGVLAYVLYYPIKNYIVKRERPYAALTGVHTGHLDTADKYSMPSGHTTAVFAVATALTLRYPKPYVYIPLYAWAAFVGYGRMYLGLHYPSDVLAGALLGTASAFAVHLIAPQITRLRERILGDDIGIQLSAAPNLVDLRITF